MKLILSILLILLASLPSQGEALYSKSFGNKSDKALIFLHGGPGYNCANFEITTAQQLADQGYYVIVYDRRGEGRSTDQNAKYTFQESFDDLNSLYKTYGIKKAGLIGHSFGGIVATLFAEKYPADVSSLILVGAPISLQENFRTIIKSTKEIYKAKNDSVNLSYTSLLETMDTSSLEYSTYSFAHAMNNKFYSPKEPTEEAKKIYALFKTDSVLKKYASRMTYQGPQGFWLNKNIQPST
jgi:proline iminopeptidase